MKIFYGVAFIFLIVIIYFFSALVPLPWYIYPPFIVLFLVSFYWDEVAKYIPWDMSKLRSIFKRSEHEQPKSQTKSGKRI